ncbi:hypothetical protein RZS08_32285, partial [Arthrospira platensis SPKY1]|nr:hypothetical protein [Arthrospira platensis SPKY1]
MFALHHPRHEHVEGLADTLAALPLLDVIHDLNLVSPGAQVESRWVIGIGQVLLARIEELLEP